MDDESLTKKALQTVAAGQQSENLLDFDDALESDGQPSGLAATTLASTPAAANLLAGTSSNPLDDLVSIFGGAGLGVGSPPPPTNGLSGLGGLGIMSPGGVTSPVATTPANARSLVGSPISQPQPQQNQSAQDDLLGLF